MKRAVATRRAERSASDVVEVIDEPDSHARAGWSWITVKASSLNRHDLWAMRGVGISEDQFPLGIGSDVAGITADGRSVISHALISDPAVAGGELLDPRRVMLAEGTTGGCADKILVPDRNLVDKPEQLTFAEAACLPTAWLTAYCMLFTKAQARPGETVLVQGAGGGVSTAAVTLARAAGLRVWVCGRDESRLAAVRDVGADATFPTGARLPERVDLVIETVGAATFSHSLKSLRPGGALVVAGATAGPEVDVDLSRVFLQHLRILGSTMGTVDDLRALVRFAATRGIRPRIDSIHDLNDTAAAVARLDSGDAVGKVVVQPSA
jgi:NADPH:quinone reductase-like Zn-dependent oxidoreductase